MRKLVSFIAASAMLLNSLIAPLSVLAQENTPTPEPTPEAISTPEATQAPEETITPTEDPTVSPTPSETPADLTTPIVSPEPTAEAETPIPTDQQIESQAPESNPTTPGPPEEPSESGQISAIIYENQTFDISSVGDFDLEYKEDGSAEISTDKFDYSPTDTAVISGSGFIAGKTYTIYITSSDKPVINFSDSLTANDEGEILYSYTLDGNYRPNYLVEVKDGEELIASTSFTDTADPAYSWPTAWDPYQVNSQPIYDDEAIGSHDDPSNGGTGVNPKSIDISSQACSQSSDPGTQPSVYINSSDSVYQFFRMRLAGDPRTSGNNNPVYDSYHWDILLDTDHNGYSDYIIDLFGDTLSVFAGTNISNTYSPTSPLWTQSTTKISNDYTRVLEVSDGCDQYFLDFAIPVSAFGGTSLNILQSANLFFSTSASNTNPLQKDWMGFAGFIFGITKQVSTDGFTWFETTTVDAGTNVYFKVSLTNTGNVDITGVSVVDTLPLGFTYVPGSTTGVTTFDPVISSQTLTWAGPFTVTSGGGSTILTFQANTPQVGIQTTFTNTGTSYKDVSTLLGSDTADVIVNPSNGILIVQKTTIPASDPTIFTINATGSGTITGGGAGTISDSTDQTYTVTAGTYYVDETVPEGWSKTGDTCQGVVIAAGGTSTCTITNTKLGKIIVEKQTLPDGSPQSFTFTPSYGSNFNLTDEQTNTSSYLSPGTYSVSESVPNGWTQISAICSDGSPVNSIDLTAGETVTCTFNNTQKGHIVVDKVTNPGGSQQSFSFTTSGTGYSGFSLKDGDTPNNQEVAPGSYTVTETPVSGWDSDEGVCDKGETPDNLDVEPGETVTCTFTNTQRGIISGYKYEDRDGDGIDDPDWTPVTDWVIELWQGGVTTGKTATTNASGFYSFTDLVQGTYQLVEQVLAGWTSVLPGTGKIDVTLNPGENDTGNNFVNTRYGSIIIEKQTIPDKSTETFDFDMNFGDGDADLTDNGQDKSENLLPGTYWITESDVEGWDLTNVSCTSSIGDNETASNLELDSGETITCVFTNTQRGSITIEKQTIPEGSPSSFEFNPSWSENNFNLTDNQSHNSGWLTPGNYTVTEIFPAGLQWDLISIMCTDDNSGASVTFANTADINLGPGELLTCTFNNTQRGSVTIVKNTIGGDGSFDFTSSTLPFIGGTLTLNTSSNTDSDTFTNIHSGTYDVHELVPEGWQLTGLTCVDPDDQSSVYPESESASIDLDPGESITCTFTNTKYATIQGRKYNDINGNGLFDIDEKVDVNRLDGWTINLYNGSEKPFKSMVTGDDSTEAGLVEKGQYKFVNLLPGEYDICEELTLPNWIQTQPNSGVAHSEGTFCRTVTLSAGQVLPEMHFGNFELTYIQGRKFNDLNANGLDDNEPLLNDWTIRLYDSGWQQVGTDQLTHNIPANGDGRYRFENLFKGTYYICENLPPDWTQTTPDVSAVDGIANGSSTANEALYCRIATINKSGTPVTGKIFGNVNYGSVTVTKFNDTDQDGYLDDGEGVLGGWDITLDTTTQVTDENGETLFSNLIAGRYNLSENIPSDSRWVQSGTYCDGEKTYNDGQVVLGEGMDLNCYIGNYEEIPSVKIEKSNDAGSGIHAGSVVTYTVTLINNGNIPLYDMYITDILPGGFSYIGGSTTGATTNDPVVSGSTLAWYIGTIPSTEDNVRQIQYKVQTSTDLADGTYTNFATCSNSEQENGEGLRAVFYRFVPISCDIVNSTVTIGSTFGYSGNLGGQVLGLSTELPATGNPTWVLIAAVGALTAGIALNVIAKTKAKKNDNPEEMAKKEKEENEKE